MKNHHKVAKVHDLEKMRAYAAKIRAIETPALSSIELACRFSVFINKLESALKVMEE